MYLYIHTYIYLYIPIYTYIHLYIPIYTYTPIHGSSPPGSKHERRHCANQQKTWPSSTECHVDIGQRAPGGMPETKEVCASRPPAMPCCRKDSCR